MAELQCPCERRANEDKKIYSRKEMEALSCVNLEGQRKKWIEVYCGLGQSVAREYDSLIDSNSQKQSFLNFDPRQQFGKKKIGPIRGEQYPRNWGCEIEDMKPMDPTRGVSVSDVDGCTVEAGECSESDDSDEYYSIQKPAFSVKGDPDFDSGPPQDGLEYLRRVRWEAAQIPKVSIAKVGRDKLNKEQTLYMPQIPDIARCSEQLLPLKQWEDAFLNDFSNLRLALSHHGESKAITPGKVQPSSSVGEEKIFHQILETPVLENLDNLTSDGVESCKSSDSSLHENRNESQLSVSDDENCALLNDFVSPSPKSYAGGGSENWPTLSKIEEMDSVSRVSALRKRIGSVETMSTISRSEGVWLFALCAAVDTPLDADTCASMRCLLRKCASLRAEKSEVDDQVIMLNILATISGKYFGQGEN